MVLSTSAPPQHHQPREGAPADPTGQPRPSTPHPSTQLLPPKRQLLKQTSIIRKPPLGDFPGGQWLNLPAPNAGGWGSILGQGTKSHILKLKILHAATKTGTAKQMTK